jgi:hypothetical protein
MAILFLYQSAVPGASFYSGLAVNFGVPWTVLTVALNAMVTILIIIPILRARNGMKNILPDDTVKIYTGVSAVLVESALPVTILGIIYAILYGTNNEVAPAFTFIWGTFCVMNLFFIPRIHSDRVYFQALSPQFIIFRVAMGKGWTREVATKQPTGSIRFGSWNPFSQGDQSKSGHSDHTAGASTAYEDDAPHVQDEKSSVSGSLPPV